MKPLTREWVNKAEGDFQVATQIMRRRKNRVLDAACFHCQQCAEKYLKARLSEEGITFPKTHDVVVLLNLILLREPLWSSLVAAAETLTDYAVDFRYPGDSASLAEARQALKDCAGIRREVRLSLGLTA
jgi:HEPN domain-containing protein